MIPQAPAPPSERCATSGPSTQIPAPPRFPRAKTTKLFQSHERDVTSRQPSTSSRRKFSDTARAAWGMRSATRNPALATKLAESIPKTQPGPTVATRRPDTAGPNRLVALWVSPSSAFAFCSRAGLTVCGTSPVDAGPKNAEAAPNVAAVARNIQNVMNPEMSANAVKASTAARTTSEAIITSRRGSRSAQTPPASVNATRAIVNDASTSPSLVAEPPTSSTANASATGINASPNAEEVRASQTRRNGLSCNGPKRPGPRAAEFTLAIKRSKPAYGLELCAS